MLNIQTSYCVADSSLEAAARINRAVAHLINELCGYLSLDQKKKPQCATLSVKVNAHDSGDDGYFRTELALTLQTKGAQERHIILYHFQPLTGKMCFLSKKHLPEIVGCQRLFQNLFE